MDAQSPADRSIANEVISQEEIEAVREMRAAKIAAAQRAEKEAEIAKNTRRYYSKIAGARFVFSDGFEIHFNYGFYDLTPEKVPGKYSVPDENQNKFQNGRPRCEVYRDELDAILGVNPMIYIPAILPVATEVKGNIPISGYGGNRVYERPANPLQTAISEVEMRQGEQTMNAAGARVSQDIGPIGTGMATDVGAGTLDQDILAAQIAAGTLPMGTPLPANVQVGPGVKNLATLKAEAEARKANVMPGGGNP